MDICDWKLPDIVADVITEYADLVGICLVIALSTPAFLLTLPPLGLFFYLTLVRRTSLEGKLDRFCVLSVSQTFDVWLCSLSCSFCWFLESLG